eukprot:SAG31_NODE_2670_length_5271_cov_4.007541_4_plen_478_part_00
MLKVWGMLLPGGESGGSLTGAGPRAFGGRGETLDVAIGQLTPAVFEAYLSWRLQWAAAEAVAGDEQEIEHEWEKLMQQREDEDGAAAEAQLAGRVGGFRSGEALEVLVTAMKDVAGRLESSSSEVQEQLCAILELAAVILTGRPRLTAAQSPLRGRAAHSSLPHDIRVMSAQSGGEVPVLVAIQTLQDVASHFMDLLHAHHSHGNVGSDVGPSPFLAQTLLETLATVIFTFVALDSSMAERAGTGAVLVAAFASASASGTAGADHSVGSAAVTGFVEFAMSFALQMLRGWHTEPGVVHAAATLFRALSGKRALRPYLLVQSAGWQNFALYVTSSPSMEGGASAAAAAAMELGGMANDDAQMLVEALCRAGLSSAHDTRMAVDGYFEAIRARFVAPIVAAAQALPHGDVVPVNSLLSICIGMRGITASSESEHAVALYGALVLPVLQQMPALINHWCAETVLFIRGSVLFKKQLYACS